MIAEKTENNEIVEDKQNPSWIKMKPKEIEELIINLAKEGHMPSRIGLILRDKHAIPKARTIISKTISEVLKEAKMNFSQEGKLIEKKISSLKSHIEKNKKDYTAKRAITKQMWNLQKSQKSN